MKKIKLSETLSVSQIAQGYWRLHRWNLSNKELLRFIEQIISMGVTTMDNADIYGRYTCEEKFGDALSLKPSLRSKIQLVTKCGIKTPCEKRKNQKVHIYDTSADHILNSVENSLKNFNTDYIDLLLIHRPDPLMNPEEVAEIFAKLKKQGKVLNFGVSNFLPAQFELLDYYLKDDNLVTNQIELSLLNLDNLNNGTVDLAMKKHIHPMIWSPLAGGKIFTGDDSLTIEIRRVLEEVRWELNAQSIDEIIYAWLLKHPVSMVPIVGSSNIKRIKSAVNATKINLSKDQWFKIYVAARGTDIL